MNTKSLLLDYGIPVLTVVGAAVVTYLLTGGEEEYPSEVLYYVLMWKIKRYILFSGDVVFDKSTIA
jgi:hypothetical protein